MEAFDDAFTGFLYRYARIDDIAPEVCGPYVDARALAYMAKSYGFYVDWRFRDRDDCPWPYSNDGPGVTRQFQELRSKFAARFMVQAAGSARGPLASLAPMIAGYSPKRPRLTVFLPLAAGRLAAEVREGRLGARDAARALTLLGAEASADERQLFRQVAFAAFRDGFTFSDLRLLFALLLVDDRQG